MAASFQSLDPALGKVETTIKLRILEAKNLPPPTDFNLKHGRDSYVVIALDQEEIFRTATVEQSLTPFFGEDYTFKVPHPFSRITFGLWEPGLKDSSLGKVSISLEELQATPIRDEQWYRLMPVDADSEVQGKLHLGVSLTDLQVSEGDNHHTQHMLTVKVLEAEGLSVWSGFHGNIDPYCLVSICPNTPGGKPEVKRGSTKRRTNKPYFQDTFTFLFRDSLSILNSILRVSLWHDLLLGDKIFIGQVNLSISTLQTPMEHRAWYNLMPRPSAPATPIDIGSLRIKIHYFKDVIYPLQAYEPLKQLLLRDLESPEHLPDSVVFMLGEVYRDWSSLGRSLVNIFMTLDMLDSLIRTLVQHEVSTTLDPNTLFRGNSLASKVIDEFMKLIGKMYLQRTLQGCIDEIFEVRRQCEIDPSRLTDADNKDVNMANLLFFVEKILSAIFSSARSCPRRMCQVFNLLKETAIAKFPERKDIVQYTSVSGFIFLRFFAPAILNPRLFHLRPQVPCPVVSRTLTLISKAIQSLGNVAGPKLTSSIQHHKEAFMTELQLELSDHSDAIKQYLDSVSDPRGGEECSLSDMVYREGMLVKRSQGRRRGPKNFRKRFFCLTSKSLTYSKSKSDAILCNIPAEDMLAVERVDEDAFNMKHMFQLVQPGRILYMQAKNSVDQLEWLTTLSKVCSRHASQVFIHTGAFNNTAWTCCGSETNDTSTGCKSVSLAVKMLTQHDSTELEGELHQVFKMFCDNQTKLLALKDKATSEAREDSGNGCGLPPRLTALCELLVFVKNVEFVSHSFLQAQHLSSIAGSKDCPFRCSPGEALVISSFTSHNK